MINPTRAETEQREVRQWRGYLGIGLPVQAMMLEIFENGIKNSDFETETSGIEFSGGVIYRDWLRLGMSYSMTTGDLTIKQAGSNIDYNFTQTMIQFEAAGIINLSNMVDLELGLALARMSGLWLAPDNLLPGVNSREHYLMGGFLVGTVINFTDKHAMNLTMRIYPHFGNDISMHGGTEQFRGALVDFLIGYRYHF